MPGQLTPGYVNGLSQAALEALLTTLRDLATELENELKTADAGMSAKTEKLLPSLGSIATDAVFFFGGIAGTMIDPFFALSSLWSAYGFIKDGWAFLELLGDYGVFSHKAYEAGKLLKRVEADIDIVLAEFEHRAKALTLLRKPRVILTPK